MIWRHAQRQSKKNRKNQADECLVFVLNSSVMNRQVLLSCMYLNVMWILILAVYYLVPDILEKREFYLAELFIA